MKQKDPFKTKEDPTNVWERLRDVVCLPCLVFDVGIVWYYALSILARAFN